MRFFGRIAWLVGLAAVLGAGSYVFIYLYRWEWHRALLAGVLLVGAEVAVATALLLRRLRTAEAATRVPDPAVLAHLHAAAPRRDHFAWLRAGEGTSNVFIPVLLGGGIVVSAIAWAIERLAGAAAAPTLERRLATELDAIALPADGLVADDAELLAQEAPYADDPELRLLLGPGAASGGISR